MPLPLLVAPEALPCAVSSWQSAWLSQIFCLLPQAPLSHKTVVSLCRRDYAASLMVFYDCTLPGYSSSHKMAICDMCLMQHPPEVRCHVCCSPGARWRTLGAARDR